MQVRNDESRYGAVAQLFHWIIVALIIAQFVLANRAGDLPLGPAKIATLAQHKSIGITILMLAVMRLAWRLMNPVPTLPMPTPAWQRHAAHISHGLLYGLLLALPIIGWLMSSARNFPVSWFGLTTLPDLIAPDQRSFELLRDTHQVLARVLFFTALLHAAAALKHHFHDRDNVLRRMLPWKLKRQLRD